MPILQGFNVEVSPSERAMLAYFLAKLHRVDPDIIVGHNMGSFALEVLQHRMAACKVPQWSRIGRLRRKDISKVSLSLSPSLPLSSFSLTPLPSLSLVHSPFLFS